MEIDFFYLFIFNVFGMLPCVDTWMVGFWHGNGELDNFVNKWLVFGTGVIYSLRLKGP